MTGGKPFLLALEGIDNAGKTTLVDSLGADLGGSLDVTTTKELTSPLGPVIREGLQQGRLSTIDKVLLFAADRQLRLTQILQAELSPAILLADRWVYSAIAYRCAENEEVAAYVEDVNRVFPVPDLTIFIDITASESLSRGAPIGKNTYGESYLASVTAQYRRLVKEGRIVPVDGMRSLPEVHVELRRLVVNELRQRGICVAE